MRFSTLISLLILNCAAPPVWAADFYVSENGDDGAVGSRSEPWATIQHAVDSFQPGDTVVVLAGDYREKIEFNRSGKKDAPLTLKAEGVVTISGKGKIGDHLIAIYNQNYIHVIGFELTEHLEVDDGSGIRVEGECAGIELRNNKIHNIRGRHAMGITVYGTSVVAPVSSIVIDGNEIYDCDPAESEALVLNGNVDGFQVTNNRIRDINNIGIDFIGGEKSICKDVTLVARNGICRGNRVERARSNYGGGFAAGIYVDGGKDILIEKNIVTESDMGIEIGAENKHAKTSGVIVRENIFYLNEKAGIVIGGYSKKAGTVTGCRFENNICYKNTSHKKATAEVWIQFADDNLFTGNILYGTETKSILLAEKGAGEKNRLVDNQYFTKAAKARFGWRGKSFEGWSKFSASVPQGDAAKFEDPRFENPGEGDFTASAAEVIDAEKKP